VRNAATGVAADFDDDQYDDVLVVDLWFGAGA
jgi:hypothetical protein